MAKQDDYARYTIRIPREIYSAIEAAAQKSGRSLNAEIIHSLGNSNVQIPENIISALENATKETGRTLNEEIVHRLATSLDFPKFEDDAFGLGSELDYELMVEAGFNGRTVKEEIIDRLKQTLSFEPSLVAELKNNLRMAETEVERLTNLLIQLTPEERRILEERQEIAENSDRKTFNSKWIGELIQMKPIGKSGRIALTVPSTRNRFPKFK